MRLKSIKLAGFKSFVDPTTVSFPGNLCAVVGPNGCGKSNIIDAVRWVMGEISAKQLRGEASTDVIFSGSSGRQPTAMASVELLFDNSDGRIGGEFAQYADIAIRRQVTRDGQSAYFLNGNRCRRRDIIDVFLGTGFGPRSYSIIEQGMISQLVEAKPDELRVYLEEAAGISKYKERRRETENRIKHTRENLERLNDLRDELARQISHLERQADAAEKYRGLQSEAGRKRIELLTLRWRALGVEIGDEERRMRELEVEMERALADQRRHEADIETCRAEQVVENERFNEIQGRFYSLGAEISRLEETIEGRERRGREMSQEQADLVQRLQLNETEQQREQTALGEHQRGLDMLLPSLDEAERADAEAQRSTEHAEREAETARSAFDAVAEQLSEQQRRLEVAASRVEHLTELIQRLDGRRLVLDDERSRLDPDQHGGEAIGLEQRVAQTEQELQALRGQIDALATAIVAAQERVQTSEIRVEGARKQYQQAASDHATLSAVQQAALGRRDHDAAPWMDAHQLADRPRLGETLHAEQGWERAVEAVMGVALRAVVIDEGSARFATELATLERGDVMLVDGINGETAPAAAADVRRRLLDVVRSRAPLAAWLAGVWVADSLEDALRVRAGLAEDESVVTRDGVWLGRHWVRVARGEHIEQGILERGARLTGLQRDSEALAEALEACQDELASARREARDQEMQRASLQDKLADDTRRLGALRADAGVSRVRFEEARAQRERVGREHGDIVHQLEGERTQLLANQSDVEQLSKSSDVLLGERAARLSDRDRLIAEAAGARRELSQVREQLHSLRMQRQAAEARITAANAALSRLATVIVDISQRRGSLAVALAENSAPLPQAREDRQRVLATRTEVERDLTASRERIESGNATLRTLDEARAGAARLASEVRSRLDERRLEWQALRTRRGGFAEQAKELGQEVELIAGQLDEAAEVARWESDLARLEQRIARLGPINLAAIDEYQTQTERKVYLDAQNDDLVSALETLEQAIRQIDKETRARFKDTFEKVNSRFQELFPKVFGGGAATLELTGEDVLDAGVSLMARPPGKRNSTIHLLSGGEKALTAISLILSIFHLNPSPVCMLDEVDAPLDDTNVGRYAQLIKEMSDEVQFIFITHNKISMELADQLMGVTMQEPGVSRLVSVDVERALEMVST